jgi:hypothetical protein
VPPDQKFVSVMVMLLVDPLASLKEQQIGWSSPSRAHAAMAFTATIIMNIRWESSMVRKDLAVQNGMRGLYSMFMDEENVSISKELAKIDSCGKIMEISNTHRGACPALDLDVDSAGRSVDSDTVPNRRPYRRVFRRGIRSYRTTSKLAALALIPFLPMAGAKRQGRLGHITQSYSEHPAPFVDLPDSLSQIAEPAGSDGDECADAPVLESLNLDTEKTGLYLLSTAMIGTLASGLGKSHGNFLVPLAVLFFIPVSSGSEPLAPEIHFESGRSNTPTSALNSARDPSNLSGSHAGNKPHVAADAVASQLPSSRPRAKESAPRGGAHSHARRKNWSSHVSSAYMIRKYQLLGIWIGVLLISCAIYWFFLREHIPPLWALAFCLLVFVTGLLYNSESNNIVNEVLTFVSGMTVFGVLRVLSHRNVLHRCQCRMCEREVNVSAKLGEGSFGAVYKARTTHRASEGAGVACVVKRVPVDLEKDINDGEMLCALAASERAISRDFHFQSVCCARACVLVCVCVCVCVCVRVLSVCSCVCSCVFLGRE